jgi:hypothetical protein
MLPGVARAASERFGNRNPSLNVTARHRAPNGECKVSGKGGNAGVEIRQQIPDDAVALNCVPSSSAKYLL